MIDWSYLPLWQAIGLSLLIALLAVLLLGLAWLVRELRDAPRAEDVFPNDPKEW